MPVFLLPSSQFSGSQPYQFRPPKHGYQPICHAQDRVFARELPLPRLRHLPFRTGTCQTQFLLIRSLHDRSFFAEIRRSLPFSPNPDEQHTAISHSPGRHSNQAVDRKRRTCDNE